MVDEFGIFEVGQRYQNRKGWYEVIKITPPEMLIRYDGGEVAAAELATQERIISNMKRDLNSMPPAMKQASGPRRREAHLNDGEHSSVHNSTPAIKRTARHGTNAYADIQFIPGQVYQRRSLNAQYGGQERGGICTPSEYPLILLFTGKIGSTYGYSDYWDDDDTFHYFGAGQTGDMEFFRGNKAIRDHVADGKDLHLFEMTERGGVCYVSRMLYIGHDYVPNVPDISGRPRMAIVFRLKSC